VVCLPPRGGGGGAAAAPPGWGGGGGGGQWYGSINKEEAKIFEVNETISCA